MLIATKSDIQHERLQINQNIGEFVGLKIRSNRVDFIPCCLYNPPKHRKYNWCSADLEKLVSKLSELTVSHKATFIIIIGNLNLPQSNWETCPCVPTETVLEILSENGFLNLINEKKKQLDVPLSDAQQYVMTANEDYEVTSSFCPNNKGCDHTTYKSKILCFISKVNLDDKCHKFSMERANWEAMNAGIADNNFYPLCYCSVIFFLDLWYDWICIVQPCSRGHQKFLHIW